MLSDRTADNVVRDQVRHSTFSLHGCKHAQSRNPVVSRIGAAQLSGSKLSVLVRLVLGLSAHSAPDDECMVPRKAPTGRGPSRVGPMPLPLPQARQTRLPRHCRRLPRCRSLFHDAANQPVRSCEVWPAGSQNDLDPLLCGEAPRATHRCFKRLRSFEPESVGCRAA